MEPILLYDSRHYVVAVKPRGVLSESASERTGNVPDMICLLSDALHSTIFPIHRLDRETAGVMVYAKTSQAAAAFSRLAAENGLDKTYLAVVCGEPTPSVGEMEDLLYHDARKNKSYVVNKKRSGVKSARLSYEVLEVQKQPELPLSLVRVHLYTGRTHQIRVQFASRAWPLAGDARYGSPLKKAELGLFAEKLCFTDPFDGQSKCFGADREAYLCATDSKYYSPLFAVFSNFDS